ncbi:T9SS type A sorting domain-containing protein [Parapedobacter sp. 10938]|uniref:T9SS type A sorting domain-containing protein n=1 Tax=Parapedobacter flavus TaxID=3110225 RepID=UPI002DBA8C85|nr:T9SS type A sorting domain-containing protein [Parapedobacter sp. 10938]MEC3878757.1 T9SS type A sorting domain-containing protein [Parapedobacter sp. 10938]
MEINSCELKSVIDAWYAVGVGSAYSDRLGISITGPDQFCNTTTYTVTNLPPGAAVTGWSVVPSSVTITGSGNSATVSTALDAMIEIIAEVSTACGEMNVVKKVAANYPESYAYIGNNPVLTPGMMWILKLITEPGSPPISNIQWTLPSGWSVFDGQGTKSLQVQVGTWSGWVEVEFEVCGVTKTRSIFCQVQSPQPFTVFPNPANETLTISVGDDGASGQAQRRNQSTVFTAILYDGSGRQHRHGESKDGKIQFETAGLPEGTYFVHIHKDGEVEKRQVVIRH